MLDLFPTSKPEGKAPLDSFLKWAHETHRCTCDIDEIAHKVFETMPDPFDRCKALVTVFRNGRDGSEFVPLIGLFDGRDYHTVWDRAYSAVHGVPLELIPTIARCDYDNRTPRFYNDKGELVFTGRTWLADRYEKD